MRRFQKVSYGMARLGSSVLMDTVDLATVLIYTQTFHLNPLYTGIAAAVAKLVIATTQFLAGYFSDKTLTRLGKRKPYLIVGAPLTAFAYVMLFSPQVFNIPVDMLFVWLLLFDSLYHIGYGVLTTPYQAWLPEITEPDERLEVSAYQNTANILALLIGTLASFMFPDIAGTEFFVIIIISFAVLEIALYLPPIIMIKEKKPKKTGVSLSRLWEDLKHMAKNRDFVIWLIVQGVASLGFITTESTVLGYVRDVVGLKGVAYYAAALVLVIVVVSSFIFWKKMASKYGNKKTLTITMILTVISLLLVYPVGILNLPSKTMELVGIAYVAFLSLGLGGWLLFPYAIVADIAHADELKTGYELCGLFTGFPSIPLNIFQAVGLVITGTLLSLPTVPGHSYSAGYIYWGFVAALFIGLASLILQKGEFDYNFEELKAIARKRDAEENTEGNTTKEEKA